MCILCWGSCKTEEHLFNGCRYGRQLWAELRRHAGYTRYANQSWLLELQWLMNKTHGEGIQQTGVRLVAAAYVYWVWKERNSRIFRSRSCAPMVLVNLIWNDVRIKLKSINFKATYALFATEIRECWGIDIGTISARTQSIFWVKPIAGRYKLNVDGSVRNNEGY